MTNDYRARIMPPDVALAEVQSGQRVYIHNGCAEPLELVHALTRRGDELRGVEVLHMATMGIADYTLPRYEGHFRHNSLFIGGNVRKAVQEGRADYTPIFLSEIEGLFTSGAVPIDVCLLQCSPPDHYGYMSASRTRKGGPSFAVTRTFFKRMPVALRIVRPSVAAEIRTFSRTTLRTGLSGRPTITAALFALVAFTLAMRMFWYLVVSAVMG